MRASTQKEQKLITSVAKRDFLLSEAHQVHL